MKRKAAFLDLLGVALLLIAATWQIFFTDWFSSKQLAHHVFVSDEMTYEVLGGIGMLSRQIENKELVTAAEVHNRMFDAVSAAVQRRDDKEDHFDKQSKIFTGIRVGLFILGSLLVAIGKYFAFRGTDPEPSLAAIPRV